MTYIIVRSTLFLTADTRHVSCSRIVTFTFAEMARFDFQSVRDSLPEDVGYGFVVTLCSLIVV